MKHSLIFYAIGPPIVLLILVACVFADESGYTPQPFDEDSTPIAFPIRMYQKFISSVNGERCPMTPSCSQYSLQAFRKHGNLLGWIMTCDRLLRCGRDEVRLSEIRRINQKNYSHDPVRNNDFWWRDR